MQTREQRDEYETKCQDTPMSDLCGMVISEKDLVLARIAERVLTVRLDTEARGMKVRPLERPWTGKS